MNGTRQSSGALATATIRVPGAMVCANARALLSILSSFPVSLCRKMANTVAINAAPRQIHFGNGNVANPNRPNTAVTNVNRETSRPTQPAYKLVRKFSGRHSVAIAVTAYNSTPIRSAADGFLPRNTQSYTAPAAQNTVQASAHQDSTS